MTVSINIRGPVGVDLEGFLDRDGLDYLRGPIGVGPIGLYGHSLPAGARGPIGVAKANQTTLYLGGRRRGKKATRGKTGLKMTVEIIEFPRQSIFSENDRKSIRSAVSSELKRIRKGLKKSKAQFTVSWTQPKTLPMSVAKPRELKVYMIENTQKSIMQAIRIRNAALPDVKRNDQELASSIGKKAGFNIKDILGKASVSFVSVTRAEKLRRAKIPGVEKIVANMILHEIGHGMAAGHSDMGLMAENSVYDSRGGRNLSYAKPSIKKIDKFLSGL